MTQTRSRQENKHDIGTPVYSGVLTGAICAGFFNPWDRGLYLSVKHQRPFLTAANFRQPFQGVYQAIFQRSLAWGSYYIVQGVMNSFRPIMVDEWHLQPFYVQMAIGFTAGSISAFINNPLSVIKYHTWGHDERKFFDSVMEHWHHGGMHSFTKGLKPTIMREIAFGIIYEESRYKTLEVTSKLLATPNDNDKSISFTELKFGVNMFSGGLATIFSSPFNYVRNMHYATPVTEKPQSVIEVLKKLYVESRQQPTLLNQVGFFRQQLRIGWGTARVAAGMAVGQLVYDQVSQFKFKK